jgi:hypothetical protein
MGYWELIYYLKYFLSHTRTTLDTWPLGYGLPNFHKGPQEKGAFW